MSDALVLDRNFARDLLIREMKKGAGARQNGAPEMPQDRAQTVAAGERVLAQLNEHLLRWFGPDGVDALLIRALDRTRCDYPVLAGVQRHAPASLRLSGITSVRANPNTEGYSQAPSAEEVAEAIITLVATILALIGRLVGDDMTRHLVRQIWPENKSGSSQSDYSSNEERLDK